MRRLLLAASLLWPTTSAAAPTAGQPYAGLALGAHLTLNEWPLRNPDATEAWPRSSSSLTLRGGFQAFDWLAAEADLGLLPLSSTDEAANLALAGGATAVLHLLPLGFELGDRPWLPVVAVGGGVYHNASGDLGADTDALVHAGLGLRGWLSEAVAIRLDARSVWSDYTQEHGPGSNLALTLGVDLFPWADDAAAEPLPCQAPPPPHEPAPCPEAEACPKPVPCPKRPPCPQPATQVRGVAPWLVEAVLSGRPARIRFEPASAEVPARARPLLAQVVAAMQRHPSLRLRIEGHTDDQGTPQHNLPLSRGRAEKVRDYLVAAGIAAERLEVSALGSSRPLNAAATPEGRAENRRVDLRVVSPPPLD